MPHADWLLLVSREGQGAMGMRRREEGRVTVQPSGFPFIHPRLLLLLILLVDVAYSPCLCSPSFCACPFLIPRSFHNWFFLNSCSFYLSSLLLTGCPSCAC